MLADGHQVALLVNSAAAHEDHSLVAPAVMGKSPSRREVALALADFAPDVLFIRNAWALSRRAARIARQSGVPAMLYNQTSLHHRTTLLRRVKLWWMGLPPQRITPVRWPGEHTPADPFASYLPWPVGELPVSGAETPADDRLRVLLVGKLGHERKNQHRLIEALERSGCSANIVLTLAGTLPSADSPHYARLRDLASRPWIRLVGERPFRDMPSLYASHDVCILPSFAEPLGTSPIEAMAYRAVPMISSQCGTAGYLTDGRDGFVFDPAELDGAVERVAALARDRIRLDDMKASAFETYRRDLSEAAFSRRFAALLARLIRSGSGSTLAMDSLGAGC